MILADVVDPVVNRAKPKLAIIDLQSAPELRPNCWIRIRVSSQDRFMAEAPVSRPTANLSCM